MKEQTHYNITPEEGWAKMKPVLDMAMPQGKPARRYPIVWWAASAIVVAGLLSVFFFEGNLSNNGPIAQSDANTESEFQSNAYDAITKSAEQGKIVGEESSSNNNVETTDAVEIQSVNKSKLLPPGKSNSTNSADYKKSKSAVIVSRQVPTGKANSNQKQNVVAIPVVGQGVTQSAGAEILNTELAMQVDRIESENLISLNRNVVVLQPMVTLPIPLIADMAARHEVAFSNSAKKAKRNPALIRPTVMASSMFGQNGGLGLYGGAGADLNLSRKFSLTTAIGYSSYKPNANILGSNNYKLSDSEFNPILNTDPLSGLDGYVYSEDINVEADYNSINPLVETVLQWQIDVGLNWRFSRRFYATGGVKFGFHAEAFSQYPIISGNTSGFPSVPQVEFSNSLSDYNVIRKSNTSMVLGLGYRLGKHFDVVANWVHGFDQYVLNTDNGYTADLSSAGRTDYIRGISVGLKYSL